MRKTMRTKTKPITRLWNEALSAMQQYYRSLNSPCIGRGKSCMGVSNVRHHHVHSSRSTTLRLEERNLVPLCSACHLSFHNGSFEIKRNYEAAMKENYGANWEAQLWALEQNAYHWTPKELREHLLAEKNKFKSLTDSK
jgi:hypothetical protein